MRIVDEMKKNQILTAWIALKPVLNVFDLVPVNVSIKMLIMLAKQGVDLSQTTVAAACPDSLDHHRWMDFAHLLTVIYNSRNEEQIYSVLSEGIF